jgi:hypothetical protein
MWPFKKKKPADTLVMLRYTKDAWDLLFPNTTNDEWKLANQPDDVALFVKASVVRSNIGADPIQKGLIATIDSKYLQWLSNKKKKHSSRALSQYLQEHVSDLNYWNDCLIESGMTSTYNVLGIPSLLMPHNINGTHSEYVLDRETSDMLIDELKKIYKSNEVFVPGWITKGSDMPNYQDDLIQLADLFWQNRSRIRFGKYLEQSYSQLETSDKFSPLYFTVPFVVKANVNNALISFNGNGLGKEDKSLQGMAALCFPEENRINLFKLISKDIPQVVSIGPKAVMPSQAYVNYQFNLIRGHGKSNIAMY